MDNEIKLIDGERLDNIGFGDLKLIQKPEEFCYGVDAVILAHFTATHSKKGINSIIDLGTGTGIIPIVLSHKTKAQRIMGVEVQRASFDRAKRNAAINELEDRVSFINGDVADFEKCWGEELKGAFDVVTLNPPYTGISSGIKGSVGAKMIARHETTASLYDFLKCAAGLLRDKGEVFMVHRPSRLADICCFGRELRLEPKEMCFVSPKPKAKANILLVHMVKNGGSELRILDPLYVYDEKGQYSKQLRENYI